MMGELIRVSGRTPDVAEFLRDAMLSQRFADVALCCPGGQRFLAHRLVLSAASPYLQEVLLAHGKSAGFCEPITVILAEVEDSELAAILGLIYTGNTAIARTRLDAFLRAAQTLRIKLPPLPEMMSCNDDCKPEDVKDVKLHSSYFQYHRYPIPYRRWFQEHDGGLHSYDRYDLDAACDFKVHSVADSSVKIYPQESCLEDRKNSDKPLEPECFPSKGSEMIRDYAQPSLTTDHDGSRSNRYVETGGETSGRCDSKESRCVVESSTTAVNLVRSGRREVEEETKMSEEKRGRRAIEESRENGSVNYSTRRSLCVVDKENLTSENVRMSCEGVRSSNSDDKDKFSPMSARPEFGSEKRFEGPGQTMENLFDLRVPSLHAPGKISEKQHYPRNGEDPTCKDGCCRWRSARRQVANHVTASPWRQLERPHHSPKAKAIAVSHDQVDNHCESWKESNGKLQRLLSTDQTRMENGTILPSSPVPPSVGLGQSMPTEQFCRPLATPGGFNGYELPNATSTPYANEMENSRLKERKLQEFYRAQMLFPRPPGPQPIRPAPVAFAATQHYYRGQNSIPIVSPAPQMHPLNGSSRGHPISPRMTLTSVQPPPRPTLEVNSLPASTKPELSHPVSRLCESTDSRISNVPVEEVAEEPPKVLCTLGNKVDAPLTRSDSNNNNASLPDESQDRRSVETGAVADEHRCEQCGKIFVTRASLKVHSRTHSGEKPFQCTDCGKQFSQLRNYKYHRSVHEGTREFAATCPECGKYFNDRGYLSSHMKIHRNRKEYACGECGKSFNQRVAYNMHVRIHTGVKPHQCEQCGKAFSRKMLLKQHLRTHSGERPYQCQVCHKAFADRSNMTLHTRLHSGLKPYQCTLCSKAFTKKHHLKTHLNYHTGTKPYSCPNCNLRFSQSSNMRTHYKKCAVNNPNGGNHVVSDSARLGSRNLRELESLTSLNRSGLRTPSAALTPPNSDQETSVLTPLLTRTVPLEMTKT